MKAIIGIVLSFFFTSFTVMGGPMAEDPGKLNAGDLDHQSSQARIGAGTTPLKDGTFGIGVSGAAGTQMIFGSRRDNDSEVTGFSLNPSVEGSVRADRKGNIQSWGVRGNVISLLRGNFGFTSSSSTPRVRERFDAGGATHEDLKKLESLIKKHRTLKTKIERHSKIEVYTKSEAPIQQAYDRMAEKEKKKKNPEETKVNQILRDFENLKKSESDALLAPLEKQMAKLRTTPVGDCTELGPRATKDEMEACRAGLNARKEEQDRSIVALQRKIDDYRQRSEEVKIEEKAKIKETYPKYYAFEREREKKLDAIEQKRKQALRENKKKFGDALRKMKKELASIEGQIREVQVKFKDNLRNLYPPDYAYDYDEEVVYGEAAAWGRPQERTVRLVPKTYEDFDDFENPGFSGMVDLDGLGVTYDIHRNLDTGEGRTTAHGHLIQVVYRQALKIAGLNVNFCLGVAPIGGAVGSLRQGKGVSRKVPGASTGPRDLEGSAYYRLKTQACLNVKAGVLGKFFADGEFELLAGNHESLNLSVNGRAGVKEILGTPLEGAWEVRHDNTRDENASSHVTTHLFTVGVSTK